ncbi:MAG: hypothetical protein AAF485_12740, partial [Chloroflexota bacterium]
MGSKVDQGPFIQDGSSSFTLPDGPRPYLLLLVILPIFAIAPLFYPGIIQTHDGFVTLWNVTDLRTNLLTPGWVPHIATSFDLLRSQGLLLYYLIAISPFMPATSLKIVISASWVFGGIGVFLWLKSWFGNPGALIAALVYLYLPHQIATVYVRGAWAETLFFGLLAWAILVTTYLVTTPKWTLLPIAMAFWGGMGLSQLGLTLWAALFLVTLLLIVHPREAKLPVIATIAGVAGVLIFMGLWASTSELHPTITFTDHFLYPSQLFSAYWGPGISQAGWDDGLSLQLGLATLGLSLIAVIIWQRHTPSHVEKADRRLIFFLGATLILILLQFGLSSIIWQIPIAPNARLSDTLTYPWQLLGLTGLCLAILAGATVWLERRFTQLPLLGAIILLIILSSYHYLAPQFLSIDKISL